MTSTEFQLCDYYGAQVARASNTRKARLNRTKGVFAKGKRVHKVNCKGRVVMGKIIPHFTFTLWTNCGRPCFRRWVKMSVGKDGGQYDFGRPLCFGRPTSFVSDVRYASDVRCGLGRSRSLERGTKLGKRKKKCGETWL